MIRAIEHYSPTELECLKSASPAARQYLEAPAEGPLAEARRRHWLAAAAATVLGTADTEEITAWWSNAADEILRQAGRTSGLAALPITLYALGKLGAEELNLSSDVDLVLVGESSALSDLAPALRRFLAAAQGGGSPPLLRVDLDLRPGGRFGPTMTTPGQLIDYYWSQGETWERLAWVRARPIFGPAQIRTEVEDAITKFCYRRFLDFTVMEDLKLLRARIHAASATPQNLVNLKLGPGGIRDLELFVHALLIIHGGRHPGLRTRSTTAALANLAAAGLLPQADCDSLSETYWQLRHLENSLQAHLDEQSHTVDLTNLPATITTKQMAEARERMRAVDSIVSDLLGPIRPVTVAWPAQAEEQIKWLEGHGVSMAIAQDLWPRLLASVARSGKTERDELARREFLGRFVEALGECGVDADLGLATLLDFVRATRAKATFFSLLLREPRLIRDLAHLFSISPYLGQMMSGRPELLDAFLSHRLGPRATDWGQFLEDLVERRQLAEMLAASQFIAGRDVIRWGQELSLTADQICQDLSGRLCEEISDANFRLVALGKWGGLELGVRSDLDFVMVTDRPPTEADQRAARRLIARLVEVHRGGRLYAVDLRLRPTGHAGPLLIERDRLIDYLSSQAAAWERQSYLRARSGSTALDSAIRNATLTKGLSGADREELRDLQNKLLLPPSSTNLDLKMRRGGLAAIEFTAQIAVLAKSLSTAPTDTIGMIRSLAAVESSWSDLGPELIELFTRLRQTEQLYQLVSVHSGSDLNPQVAEFNRLARLLKLTSMELVECVNRDLESSAQLLARLDPLAGHR